jgi:uncharacterized protein YuzE
MKIDYFPATDTLYIALAEKPSVESEEITEGVVMDFDAAHRLVGIEIEGASTKVELQQLLLAGLPGKVITAAA